MIPLPAWATVRNLVIGVPIILFVILVCYGVHLIRVSDFDRGAASVQKLWDADKQKTALKMAELQTKVFADEEAHKQETKRISDELAKTKKVHVDYVARLTADFDQRMRLSQERADFYQHQAEGSTIECRGLADHAGKLDASLEEGRGLVQELGAALRLRDAQVKLLGDQIQADRALLR